MTTSPDTTPNDCIRPVFGDGPNPTCQPHGWWNRDTAALTLADLTRELKSSWAAARQTFGGGS